MLNLNKYHNRMVALFEQLPRLANDAECCGMDMGICNAIEDKLEFTSPDSFIQWLIEKEYIGKESFNKILDIFMSEC